MPWIPFSFDLHEFPENGSPVLFFIMIRTIGLLHLLLMFFSKIVTTGYPISLKGDLLLTLFRLNNLDTVLAVSICFISKRCCCSCTCTCCRGLGHRKAAGRLANIERLFFGTLGFLWSPLLRWWRGRALLCLGRSVLCLIKIPQVCPLLNVGLMERMLRRSFK